MTKKATNKIDYQGKIVIPGGRNAKVVNEIQNKLKIVFQKNEKYQGKIVISGGRKAKVVNEIWNKLEIVFQENGKYQGNVAAVKKGEVSLLDKRKHPEKDFLKTNKKVSKKRGDKKENNELPQNTPRWRKIELLLEAFEKNPKNPDYPLLLLFEKKTLEIVVNQFPNSRVINLLAKVTEKYYLAWFEYDLNELEKDPTNMKNINYFKEMVKEAKEESIVTINTKQYEDRLPQNSKELYYLAQLKDFLEAFEKNPTNLYALKDIKNYVEQSEKESIDVSAYKALLPELTIKHYEAKLEKYFNELQKKPEDFNLLNLFKSALQSAKEAWAEKAWVDLSKYEAFLPELTIKHYEAKLEKYFNELQKDPEDSIWLLLFESALWSAKKAWVEEAWVDLSKYEEFLDKLNKANNK